MTVRHSEGETTIFPFEHAQVIPDDLLTHPHVKGGIDSGWITVVPTDEAIAEVLGGDPLPVDVQCDDIAEQVKSIKPNRKRKAQ